MRSSVLAAAAVVALALLPSAAIAKGKARPPPPPPTHSVSGTIAVTNVLTVVCAVVGTRGTTTSTVRTIWEYSISGRGTPGGRAKRRAVAGSGSSRAVMRQRVVTDETVEGTTLIRPSHAETAWKSSGRGKDGDFGRLVQLVDGQLVVDLASTTGRRERKGAVRPAPGASASVVFNGAGREERVEDHAAGCFQETSTTTTSGTLNVSQFR